MTTHFATREQNEVARSASEASKIVIKPVRFERYLNPPVGTPFPLEYSFHLLGDARGRTVLDLGCGSGEETIPLVHRGARVIGIDISPDLIAIARRRLDEANLDAEVRVGSAYDTELPSESVDVIFSMSLVHHLELPRVRDEMLRVLRPGGFVVLKEPIRFSGGYARLLSFLPKHEDISEYEHPLTVPEFEIFQQGFQSEGLRFFRLPLVPLVQRSAPAVSRYAFRFSNFLMTRFPAISRYATVVVVRLRKPGSAKADLGDQCDG
jgi:SAM-dependent methyltransferase